MFSVVAADVRLRFTWGQMRPSRASCKSAPWCRAQVPARGNVRAHAQLEAVIFDCDGVILESEDLHRRAYNAAFQNFRVECDGSPVVWSEEFYDELQNTVGGGKPKMRWYFSPDRNGWPTSSIVGDPPRTEDEQALLIDTLQDWKSEEYRRLIGSGEVPPRPGVLQLMDDARAAGYKVAVCSAATKESVIFTLQSLLGPERFDGLDCFMAGDDVPRKKPDPIIYQLASERLGVDPRSCVVIEDSTIGLRAALGAGMRCVVTYTPSTKEEPFEGAEVVIPDLGDETPRVTLEQLAQGTLRYDSRVTFFPSS